VRQKLEEDKMKVEGIKQRKLGELKSLGIHDKYQHDLAKKKIQWAKPPKHTPPFLIERSPILAYLKHS